MNTYLLYVASGVLSGIGLLLFARRRLETGCAVFAVATVVNGIAQGYEGDTGMVALNAASFAVFVVVWWIGGGGDRTRRRLRRTARAFRGVRRTAPAGGAA
ncbi:hypothetical protein [Streptomyces collinus]